MPAMTQNRRLIPRSRKRLRVEVDGSAVFTVDVSPGGFCAESMRVPSPGSVVHGKIRVENRELAFAGRVAWARASEPRLQLRGRMGVQFTQIDESFYKLFERTG